MSVDHLWSFVFLNKREKINDFIIYYHCYLLLSLTFIFIGWKIFQSLHFLTYCLSHFIIYYYRLLINIYQIIIDYFLSVYYFIYCYILDVIECWFCLSWLIFAIMQYRLLGVKYQHLSSSLQKQNNKICHTFEIE